MQNNETKAAMEKTIWLPDPHQIFIHRNRNYFHSLFLGLTNPLWHLPFMIFHILIKPAFKGAFFILSYWARTTVMGLSGSLITVDMNRPKIVVLIDGKPHDDSD
ncbi:hypothetical protein QN372_00210 [Undibacterium sp. RTI2.1]|uniref:hypothetical protein n=1 Tax=unclassified Undibacterium TaxID=2630295 RepID=UPI002AB52012|nr:MULTISPECIES: hypothetical protein [unclassified Undibacterium]MDY7537564.1 hypothetical protein [Undibacterium sp. 5I1]MEB0029161.1 hypothetical protein [Undibacterium sp. RTI2.1]MEB0115469.1 hypothetical protein [Undibacterium sp. RTI2.2]MEB0231949.1 hypothetical protein [Undibacterium sp. 10I3]MEB0256300.1 hypothetical protein [Undibacterium sp. 5I1]